jgi:periplasmic mercuric ion binding protein
MPMSRTLASLALITVLASSNAAKAAVRTVTFAIENMTCVTCPYIVKKTLASVPGVAEVTVSFEKKIAVVTFDDVQTTVDQLVAATGRAGFPSRLVTEGAR